MNRVKAAFLFVLVLGLTACDMKDKLDRMSETTEQMGDSTENLETQSEHLSDRTEELYVNMREVESVNMQNEAFTHVLEDEGVISKAHYALIYFGAMEFQHWRPGHTDDEPKRDRLFLKSVEMFFSKIDDLVEDSFPISTLLPSNEWISLSVLAVGMSKIHPEQYARAEHYGFQALSFYDVLKQGLRLKAAYESGESVPEYAVKILENERTVRYLLQLRHNFFKALVLGRLTTFEEGLWDRFWMLIWGWDVDLSRYPAAEVSLLNEWLWKSMETQTFISEIGDVVVHNDNFQTLFENGTIYIPESSNPDLEPMAQEQLRELKLEQVHFLPAYEMFRQLLPEVTSSQDLDFRTP